MGAPSDTDANEYYSYVILWAARKTKKKPAGAGFLFTLCQLKSSIIFLKDLHGPSQPTLA